MIRRFVCWLVGQFQKVYVNDGPCDHGVVSAGPFCGECRAQEMAFYVERARAEALEEAARLVESRVSNPYVNRTMAAAIRALSRPEDSRQESPARDEQEKT